MTRPLHLGAALDGAGWHPAAWRDAAANARDSFTLRYWVDLVEKARAAGFDLVTIEDSFGLQEPDAGRAPNADAAPRDPDHGGTDAYRGRLDALLVAAAVAPVVPGIGIVPTVTTTHTEPFHVATAIQSLDHASEGWAGWRVQTSSRAHEADHLGRRKRPAVDIDAYLRREPEALAAVRDLFDEAAEVVEVVRLLWDSWEDDAVIRDVSTGRFLDRDKLHYVDFVGERFSVKGPSITPRSPQGQPLVYALAHAAEPFVFASRQADIVGITPHDADELDGILAALRAAAADTTRTAGAETLRVWAEAVVLIEETDAQARAALDGLDLALGRPYSSDALVIAGSPQTVAEQLLRWHGAGLDGVRVRPARLPVDLTRFGAHVHPLLADAGVTERPAGASSLRERLGFGIPANRFEAAHARSAVDRPGGAGTGTGTEIGTETETETETVSEEVTA